MKLAQGDMWSVYDQADLFLVTTNGVVTRYGKLVMGAGIARQTKERFPVPSGGMNHLGETSRP